MFPTNLRKRDADLNLQLEDIRRGAVEVQDLARNNNNGE